MMTRCVSVSAIWLGTLVATIVLPAPTLSAVINFRATYIRIVDGEDFFGAGIDLVIEDATMSGDGSTVMFYGKRSDTSERKIYLVDADGSDLTDFLLPANPDQPSEQILVSDLAISRNGSRAFFVTPWWQHRIYKIESGTLSEILDMDDWPEIVASVSRPQVRTTWDGQYAYFQEDRDDIWRVHRNGGAPTLVVDDKTVLRNGGLEGWAVGAFDVSDDGGVITFVLKGYWNAAHTGIVTIADLEPRGFNVGGNTLTATGDRMFYYDTEARGGRFTRTDGVGGLDLFPAWDVNNIAIASTWDPVTSDDGSRVCFRHDLSSL